MRLLFALAGLSLATPAHANQSTAHWRFEEAGGTTVVDFGPEGLDGTHNGLPLRVPDVAWDPVPHSQLANTQSLDLNWMGRTSGGTVTVPDPDAFLSPGATSFTLEAWVRLSQVSDTSSPNQRQWLATKKPALSGDEVLDFGFLVQAGSFGFTGRELAFSFGDGTTSVQFLSTLTIDDTAWHFVSVAYDAGAEVLRFGLDGAFDTRPFVKPANANHGPLLLGAHVNASGTLNQFVRGRIDEVRYTRRFLAPELLLDAAPQDCNANFVADFVEIATGAAPDCNGNCIPDECDVSSGAAGDCQPDGVLDECQLADHLYRLNESDPDGTVISDGTYTGWLNRYVVEDGRSVLTHLEAHLGALSVGTDITLYVWSDPNGDGDPTDAGVLFSLPLTVEPGDDGFLARHDIPDVVIGPDGTSFFVGALNATPNSSGAAFDNDAPHVFGASWIVGSNSPIDPNNLSAGAVEFEPIETDFPGNFVIGGVVEGLPDCNLNGVPDACDIAQGMPDLDLNGVPDACETIVTVFVPDHYPTIQAALNVVPSGSVVVVRPGIYAESFDFVGKEVLVRSELGADVTTIDGTGLEEVIRFTSGEGPGAILHGFTVSGAADVAIRIQDSSPTIVGNVITGNASSSEGGGIRATGGSAPRIVGNELSFNTAGVGGGVSFGLANTSPWVEGNVFEGNQAGLFGGGLSCINGSPVIRNNVFRNNSSDDGGGAGLLLTGHAVPRFERNLLHDNVALGEGGGLACSGTNPVISDNVFVGNVAQDGGGLFLDIQSRDVKRNTILHNTALGTGGGLFVNPFTSSTTLASNVIRDNSASALPELAADAGVTVRYCNVDGGYAGSGNFDALPSFVDPDGPDDNVSTFGDNDYRLLPGSPCVDAGDPADVPGLDLDRGGNARPCDGDGNNVPVVDVGAFELGGCYVDARPFGVK